MVEFERDATEGRRTTGSTHGPLLTRIQDGLASHSPGPRARRCPCCGAPIRAGQRLTTIHGTSVHARCASKRL